MQAVIMPKQGLQMTEGVLTRWIKQVGEAVTMDEPLFEMETDKLTISIDAKVSGTLLKILHPVGDTVPVTEVIAYIGEPGEDVEDVQTVPTVPQSEHPVAPIIIQAPEPVNSKTPDTVSSSRRFITPRAKWQAEERNVPLDCVTPTGPDGLIIERDVIHAKIPEIPAVKTMPATTSQRAVEADFCAANRIVASLARDLPDYDAYALLLRAIDFVNKETGRAVRMTRTEADFGFANEPDILMAGAIRKNGACWLSLASEDPKADVQYLRRIQTMMEQPMLLLCVTKGNE